MGVELNLAADSLWFQVGDWGELLARLSLAAVAGAILGWNREVAGKAAGLRTHMLVSLGSALFVMIPLQAPELSPDALSRTIQGVAAGIGFLGAGQIFQQTSRRSQRTHVKGLTSAAAIWVSAALGVVAACGLWRVILIGTLLTFSILSVARRVEGWVLHDQPKQEEP